MNCRLIFITIVFVSRALLSQNETAKWYFGNMAAVDFMNGGPTALGNSVMFQSEGCASIADSLGSLLFYTNGIDIWNKTHVVMANGSGLLGHGSTSQSALIVKQPGNTNIYFVFTLDVAGYPNGLKYSIVDMNLAAGMGSVTAKNIPVYAPSCEKLCATAHCNGTDIWVVTHEFPGTNFRADLVTAAGLNPVPVISNAGPTFTNPVNTQGCMKISPTGKNLGLARFWPTGGGGPTYELYDFDNATGVVSNPLSISAGTCGYSCEFSPDGTKFYGGGRYAQPTKVYQWDLCAGSGSAIIASQYTVTTTNSDWSPGHLQLALDGKMYLSKFSKQDLGVINNPNLGGSACNYNNNGPSILPGTAAFGLPNFVSSLFRDKPSVTYSVNCVAASFTASVPTNTVPGCVPYTSTITALAWNFGDPSSGINNVSSGYTPTHYFSAPGTYTVLLTFSGPCNNYSIKKVVNISSQVAAFGISGPTLICNGMSAILSANTLTNSYVWSTGSNAATITVSPAMNTIYTVTATDTSGCSVSKTYSVNVHPCTGLSPNTLNAGVKIYPNPANNLIFISVADEQIKTELTLHLADASGREIKSIRFMPEKDKDFPVNIENVGRGIYIITINRNKELLMTAKFVIQD